MPKSKLRVNWTRDDSGQENLSVYYDGQNYVANNTHPAWDQLMAKAMADDPTVVELFDIGMAVGKRLELSDRVSYAKGYLFLDGDRISDGLADHIVRMINAEEDVKPFVLLLENIIQNPSLHSRDQLYRYIDKHKITITHDGRLVLYKYVFRSNPELKSVYDATKHAAYRSGNGGPAIVNGYPHKTGHVPQDIGDVVAMPRADVADDPTTVCSTGLHVGSWKYVNNNGGNVLLEVHVHPRDVVSVPRDANEQKVRVCRYKIIGEVTKEYDGPVLPAPEPIIVPVPEPIEEPTGIQPVQPVKHPTQKEWDRSKIVAKLQRKGHVAYIETRMRWRYLGGDVKDRTSWSVK